MTTADIQAKIRQAALSAGIPPSLALAVANAESSFNPVAVGSSGEVGIFQLKPAAAKDVGVTDRYDVDQNIAGGVAYLASQYRATGGDVDATLWRYNAGPGNYANGIKPGHTSAYIANVNADIPNWSDEGATMPLYGAPASGGGDDSTFAGFLPEIDQRTLVLVAIALSLLAAWYILPGISQE